MPSSSSRSSPSSPSACSARSRPGTRNSSRREMALGEIVPFLLNTPRVLGHQLDRLADLPEETCRLLRAAGLLEQQRVAAPRFLPGIVGGQRFIFVERRVAVALHLEAARVEQMTFRRAVARIGGTQPLQRDLRLGEILLPEIGAGEAEHEGGIGRMQPGQQLAIEAGSLVGTT